MPAINCGQRRRFAEWMVKTNGDLKSSYRAAFPKTEATAAVIAKRAAALMERADVVAEIHRVRTGGVEDLDEEGRILATCVQIIDSPDSSTEQRLKAMSVYTQLRRTIAARDAAGDVGEELRAFLRELKTREGGRPGGAHPGASGLAANE